MRKDLDWGTTGNGLLDAILVIFEALVELLLLIGQLFGGGGNEEEEETSTGETDEV